MSFSDLPSYEEVQSLIEELKEMDLSQIDQDDLGEKMNSGLRPMPMLTAKISKGHYIDRGRIHEDKSQVFYSEEEISYRQDFKNIHSYGRANFPKDSLFYGALKSELIPYPRLINLLETSEIFRNINGNRDSSTDFYMTVGRWRVIKDIITLDIVYSSKNRGSVPEIEKRYNEQRQKLINDDIPEGIAEQIELILTFLSDEFAKKDIQNHHDYKISATYFDMARRNPKTKLQCVSYPSTRANYLGNNVALTPFAVDRYLQLDRVAMFHVVKNGVDAEIRNLKIAKDLGVNNSDFKWVDVDDSSEDELDREMQH